MTRLRDLRSALADRLRPLTDTPDLDAAVLLAHVLGRERTWLEAHPEFEPDARQLRALEAAARRLESGDPLPYVLGKWEFFGHTLTVTPDVLIPRPETELLVEHALAWLRAHPGRRAAADIGTGSGCIAIALAAAIPDLHVLATDVSRRALRVARLNARRVGVDARIEFYHGDLLPARGAGPFDLIAANLPYIPTETLRTLPIYGHEPTVALDGGADGLDLIRALLHRAPTCLKPGGIILMEIEASEGLKALSLAYDAFHAAEIRLHHDLAGRDRLITIETHAAE